MARRMLIDASHPEETRVVVVDGTRLEEFDFETATRKPLKGNIYLAKVIRIEPSLQAAFVEYGGNRHGFLAFSEIHPDYYQIPVADRERLIAEQQRLHGRSRRRRAAPPRQGRPHRHRGSARGQSRARAAVEPAGRRAAGGSRRAEAIASAEDAGDRAGHRPGDQPSRSQPARSSPSPSRRPQPAAIASERVEGPAEIRRKRRAAADRHAVPTTPRRPSRAAEQPATDRCRSRAPRLRSRRRLTRRSEWQRPTDLADAPQPEVTVETLGGDDADRGARDARAPPPQPDPPVQDPGSHQAPADPAGAGRQGRARQQGRGADHLPVAGRPLLRADAQHRPRRRHLAQDLQRRPTASA